MATSAGQPLAASPCSGKRAVGGRRLGQRSDMPAIEQCSMQGCSGPVTAMMSSIWTPGKEWKVCDTCQWLFDPDSLGSDENIQSEGAWTKGSSRVFLDSENEASACVLQETTMSTKNHHNLSYEGSSNKYNEKALVAAPIAAWHKFEKVLSFRKLTGSRMKKCNMDDCDLGACSLWTIWDQSDASDIPTKKPLYLCLDCQEQKFGGWPTSIELLGKGFMSEEKRDVITRRCSKQSNPIMPPAFVKDLA